MYVDIAQRAAVRRRHLSVATALAESTHHSALRGPKQARAGGGESEAKYTAEFWTTPLPFRQQSPSTTCSTTTLGRCLLPCGHTACVSRCVLRGQRGAAATARKTRPWCRSSTFGCRGELVVEPVVEQVIVVPKTSFESVVPVRSALRVVWRSL